MDVLHTRRLVLRHFVPEDAPALLRLNGEPTTRAALPSHVYADLSEAEAAVRYLIGCYSSPGDANRGPYVLGVDHRETGQLLGHVGFSPLTGEVEISYAIAEAARGQGYGTEALVAACRWAAATFALDRLVTPPLVARWIVRASRMSVIGSCDSRAMNKASAVMSGRLIRTQAERDPTVGVSGHNAPPYQRRRA